MYVKKEANGEIANIIGGLKEDIIRELPDIATIPICVKGSGSLEKTHNERHLLTVGSYTPKTLQQKW